MVHAPQKSIIGVMVLSLVLSVSCSVEPEEAEVQDIGCVGNYLGQFIESIPLPGFSILGKIGGKIMTGVAGAFRGKATSSSKGLCGTPATFSETQMAQMKEAIKTGFSDQNHVEATALMNKIDVKLRDFVPDEERFTGYTMTNLQSIIDDVTTWWSKYDQSGTRIYNVHDFVIVTGFALKAYQQQVRQVALEANSTKSPGDAKKVRQYAGILSDKANHARVALEEISNKDIVGVTRTFWKNEGKSQTKKFFVGYYNAHCYESTKGRPYNDMENLNEKGPARTERFLAGMRATKTLGELSNYVSENGTVCCMDNYCHEGNIEKRIQLYMDETTKQVKQVMFYNDAAIMNYFNETLPLFIRTGQMIREASDSDIYSLSDNTQSSVGDEAKSSGDDGYCPNGGRGYGDVFQCGSDKCAKTHDRWSENPPQCKVKQ